MSGRAAAVWGDPRPDRPVGDSTAERLRMCKMSKLPGEKHGQPGKTTRRLRFSGRSGPFDAAQPRFAPPQRQENARKFTGH